MHSTELSPEIANILGLRKHEKLVLSAISSESKHISLISRHTKIARTSLLYILKKLEKRGLVIRIQIQKMYYWKSDTVNALRAINNSGSEITVYEGKESILNMYERLIDLPQNTRIKGIQPDKSIKQAIKHVDVKEWDRINKIIKDKKFVVEGIVHEKSVDTILKELGKDGAKIAYNSFIGRLEDYVKIPDDFADVESEIYIFGRSVYILNWGKEMALEIRNKDMVELLTAMFSCVKELGQRYSQNQKMEKYAEVIK